MSLVSHRFLVQAGLFAVIDSAVAVEGAAVAVVDAAITVVDVTGAGFI